MGSRNDDPEADGTDFAHPAWWRGHDDTVNEMCKMIREVINGEDDGSGVANEPWESTRRLLLDLVKRAGNGGPTDA